MDTQIGIIRSGGTLTARRVRQTVFPDFESREAVAEALADPAPWYELINAPLTAGPLLSAWETLGQTPDVRGALQTVLAETVLGTPSPGVPSPPPRPEPERPPATAAHPRAYSGTKYKPPTPKTPLPIDLRPLLCGTGRVDGLTELQEAARTAEARLPEGFRRALYPLVRGQGSAEALALYWALELEDHPARLAAAAMLLARQTGPLDLEWAAFAATLPDEWRTPFLYLLLASGADAAAVPASLGEHFTEVFAGPDPAYRAYWLLHGLTTGIAPDYLLAGFRLAETCAVNELFHDIWQSGYYPAIAFVVLWEQIKAVEDTYRGYPLHFWERCGKYEGLGEIVETVPWIQYEPTIAYRYLRLFAAFYWDDLTPEQEAAKWQCIRWQASSVESLLQSVPAEFQRKAIDHLAEYFWQWNSPETLNELLPLAYTLTRRLCQPPFAKKNDAVEVSADFLAELDPSLRERFLNAPDKSFRQLEAACRRDNDSMLVGGGTWALTRQAGEFAVRGFEEHPARLFGAAKLLGSLSDAQREQVVREAALDGQEVLAGLKSLEQRTLAALATGLPASMETSADRHALQMQRRAAENRRGLRRLLDAHWRGDTDYVWNHPRTRFWRQKHPGVDWNVWRGGLTVEGITETGAAVTLAVETDPLEALKLGTYVGSCLGLGGAFAYSAAAVVLDFNKQVIYARDATGTVVGRQVVALSEARQVVCFEVYPLDAQKRLGPLFAAYDRQWSAALGLPVYEANDEYDIAHILSHEWWDDMAWNLKVDEENE